MKQLMKELKKGMKGTVYNSHRRSSRATLLGDLVEPLLQEPAGGKEVTAFVDVK